LVFFHSGGAFDLADFSIGSWSGTEFWICYSDLMNALEGFALVSGIASIAGLIYAIYYGRLSVRRKLLAYDLTPPVPLATVFQPDDTHHLTVVYQRDDRAEERIDAAFIRFVRFANFGSEPIRREDIALANPLRVSVYGARTLDVALVGSRRSVCRVELHPTEATLPDGATSRINFDFLDEGDGGLVRVVTAGHPGSVRVEGDIIGMPTGVRPAHEVRPHNVLNIIGCSLGVAVQLAALVLTPFIFRWTTGSWENAWVMALPLLALILPGVIVGIIATTIWPESGATFPKELNPPHWFHSRLHFMMGHGHHVRPFDEEEMWSSPAAPRKNDVDDPT
jgi:hypothetical protein